MAGAQIRRFLISAQGARRRRRRADPHPEGAPRLHRRALCGRSINGTLRRLPRQCRHRDASHLRGRPQGHDLGARDRCSDVVDAKTFPAATVEGRRRSEGRLSIQKTISPAGIAKGDVLLSVENVSLSFGGVKRDPRRVVRHPKKGEIRAIIGPNGAGKTSMLNVINGFYHPQQGRHHLQGRDARQKMRPYMTPRSQRHRPHVPERRPVQGHEQRSTTS